MENIQAVADGPQVDERAERQPFDEEGVVRPPQAENDQGKTDPLQGLGVTEEAFRAWEPQVGEVEQFQEESRGMKGKAQAKEPGRGGLVRPDPDFQVPCQATPQRILPTPRVARCNRTRPRVRD